MADPDLSVIVPNWNGALLLPACLESIRRHSSSVKTEVVVFDNGSTDESLQVIRGAGAGMDVQVVEAERNLGFASACNGGIRAARAGVILLLNNDAELCGDLRLGLDYLAANPRLGACQGPLLMTDRRHVDSVGSLMGPAGFLRHEHIGELVDSCPDSMAVFSVKGAAMWLRREALGGRPPFDDDAFAYFEESDLCWRLWVEGWEVSFSDKLPPVVHKIGATSTRLSPALCQFHSFKNRLRAILRYTEGRTLVRMLPRHILWSATIAGGLTLTGDRTIGPAVVRALWWNARRAGETVRERRVVAARRAVSDREIFRRVGVPLSLRDLQRQSLRGNAAEQLAIRSTNGEGR